MSRELIEFSDQIDEQFELADIEAAEAFWLFVISLFD